MAVNRYSQAILDTLQGRTKDLRPIPPERLDWAGPGALLELYDRTSGTERTEIIRAMGQVIRSHRAPPAVLAQLVDIASSLGIAEVEPEVRALRKHPVASQEPLQKAIANYLTFRELSPSALAATPDQPATSRRGPSPKSKSRHGSSQKR